jgi:TetR/AcrR family transcriptional regulator
MLATQRKTTALGEERKQSILVAAREEFEQFGYAGSRMQHIADMADVPKANIHYYFHSKLELYNAVLEDVVHLWDQTFESLDPDDDPKKVLADFVRKKVEFTRLYPEATRIFASEMLHGAPHLSSELNEKMNAWTQDRAQVIAQWIRKGKIAPIDPYHLIFMIWSSTQHFAGYEAQIKLIYEVRKLGKKDFDDQAKSLTTMVHRICGLE